MHEQPDWTPGDDEVVRGALNTLRLDAEALPLADVRFVKARGVARRRRAQVVGVASAAAAVAAISFVGFHNLGSNQGLDLRPAATSTTATTAPGQLAAPGPLPVSVEWQRALNITEVITITDLRSGEGVFADCPVSAPGAQLATGSVHAESTGLDAAQAVYRASSPDAGNAAAAAAVGQIVGCRSPGMQLKVEADAAWPKVFSTVTVTPDGQRHFGWYVVAHQGSLTSLIGVFDSGTATPRHPLAQIQALALVAQQRLVQEVEGAGPPATGTSEGVGQDIPMAGTQPLPSSNLFVAPSQWSSPGMSANHATHAVTTDFEGSPNLFRCDADSRSTQGADAGWMGIVAVADEVTGTFLGKQRVRLMGSPAAAAAELKRLTTGVTGCVSGTDPATVTVDPAHQGRYRITSGTGSQQLVNWVAVAVNEHTPDAVSTISLTGRPELVDGFAELDRFVALAIQK